MNLPGKGADGLDKDGCVIFQHLGLNSETTLLELHCRLTDFGIDHNKLTAIFDALHADADDLVVTRETFVHAYCKAFRPLPVIRHTCVDFAHGVLVFSQERKFIVPIPAFPGEPLVFPEEHPLAGQLIQYTDEGDEGVRWWNDITHEWQGVVSDGTGAIVINQIGEEEAGILQEWVAREVGTPQQFTFDKVKDFILFSKKETGKCVYNVGLDKYLGYVNLVDWGGQTGIRGFGLHRKRADEVFRAVLVTEEFIFEPAGYQHFPEGCAIISNLKSPGSRCVLKDTFAKTYHLHPSGAEIKLEDLPRCDGWGNAK